MIQEADRYDGTRHEDFASLVFIIPSCPTDLLVILFTTFLLARWSQLIDLFWLRVDFSKRWWGKNQDFMLIRLFNASDLIGCGGGH